MTRVVVAEGPAHVKSPHKDHDKESVGATFHNKKSICNYSSLGARHIALCKRKETHKEITIRLTINLTRMSFKMGILYIPVLMTGL